RASINLHIHIPGDHCLLRPHQQIEAAEIQGRTQSRRPLCNDLCQRPLHESRHINEE
ncbi:hypothetical protein FRB97_004775, partial [Tulasnella sp. 331]